MRGQRMALKYILVKGSHVCKKFNTLRFYEIYIYKVYLFKQTGTLIYFLPKK